MKNSRISSPRKMVSCFAMMFVQLWKFLAMIITQISGSCSLIRQKWAWRWFYSREIDSPPLLWLMQPSWRKVMKAWRYCWESLTNLSGSYSECNSGTQNIAVSCVSGTARTRRITMSINCGLKEHHWLQGRKVSSFFLLFFRRKFICPLCT